jgi:transposase
MDEDNMNQTQASPFVGIDVSKRELDVAVGAKGGCWQAGNEPGGIGKTVSRLREVRPALVVVESTGGLELPLLVALHEAGLPFCRVHPGRVREFAKSIGLLAKTDKLDARLLARFAEAVQPAPTRLPSPTEQELSALMARRRQVVEMLTAEKNRLGSAPATVRERLRQHILWLEEELAQLNRQLEALINQTPDFKDKNDLLQSVPGVGPVTAALIAADFPNLVCSTANRLPLWSAWPLSTTIVAVSKANGASKEADLSCALSYTWRPCPLFVSIPSSTPFMTTCWPRANRKK